ncbi:MAG: chromate efflux transporter [Sandaracinaceae bacterium]
MAGRPDGSARLVEVASTFLRLGCTSFGGPIAHLGYFRSEIVEKQRWLDDARYADLVALCQFLPGPASSQVVFALGMHRAGLAGAVVASVCFTLPSALLMLAFAYGMVHVDVRDAGWLRGLRLAAVAVVAQAVWAMGRKLCPDRARAAIALGAASLLLVVPGAPTQIGTIFAGGAGGWWLYRDAVSAPGGPVDVPTVRGGRLALAALLLFATLLVVLPVLVAATGSSEIAMIDAFYRAGSLVFGGGHVILPLLRAELVPPGWIDDDAFLAGYAAAQAVPGPLFTFSAYLGAVMREGSGGWTGGLACLLAIFAPAWLLVGGALPFWTRLRAERGAQATLAGANAAVVGVLLAALYDPIFTESVRGPRDAAAALGAFGLLEITKAPPWVAVAACAAAGQWLLPP